MRIIEPTIQYKEVTWHGLTLQIPQDHVAVAADHDGWVYSYTGAPTLLANNRWALAASSDYYDICKVDLEGMPWQETLVEYPL
jgi:hypothetical protein